jgi:uroporphyrin-III C-methyltransferase/precorrin-2 dehydrogenase/sirohydrochlorin ferrochelatase
MQSFPLFLSLQNRRALVVGGTDHAARKVELLLSAGAQVLLIAETVTGEIAQLIADRRICWGGRRFDEADLVGVSLVIVAAEDEALQARVSQRAQAHCVPVNVVDRPALSSFIMPAIVDRGPVTIAISTGGSAPALARKLRAEIERALPVAIGRLARFAEIFRAQVRRTVAEPRARRLFWDRVFDGGIGELALAGDEIGARRELIRLLDSARHDTTPAQGMVHLVGAGPGDPDLLTLKAHRLLQRADVIVHDRLVSPEVLATARRDAERICVGSPGAHRVPPEEINRRLVALVRSGKSVVRLTGGDASTFRRDGKEIDALMAAGVTVEIVPGIMAVTIRRSDTLHRK